MRQVPQVDGEKRPGMNLFMCIPPDHQRNDLPTYVSMETLCGKLSSFPFVNAETGVFVCITDDMGNTVTLPCFDAVRRENKLLLMAYRTGRPEK